MENGGIKFSLLFIFLANTLGQAQQNPNHGKLLFAPGVVSTKKVEYAASLTYDVKEVYFARSEQEWGKGEMKSTIYHSRLLENSWSEPEVVSFSGLYDDSDPHITYDGTRLFFISKRPSSAKTISADIWMVAKTESGSWGQPIRLSDPINSEQSEYSPTTDGKGNLYFASTRSGGLGQGDLYMAKMEEGVFGTPINLGNTLNSATGEWNLEVSSNGQVLLFEASGREQNVSPYGDLYISFKQGDAWTVPQNVSELNTSGSDLYAHIEEESNMLYYTSSDSLKSGTTNIYITNFAKILEKYRK